MTVTAEPNLDPEDLEDALDAEIDGSDDESADGRHEEIADDGDDEVEDDAGDEVEADASDEIEDDTSDEIEDDTSDEIEVDSEIDHDDDPGRDGADDVHGLLVAKRESQRAGADENPVRSPGRVENGTWSTAQARSVLAKAAAVVFGFGLVGLGLGATRGSTNVVRNEFVYTLNESVPDSFLREDRRLLTQVVTLTSDAVLVPVADRFDLSVEDLRRRIDVETVELSEVIRLEVTHPERATAIAISEAVIERYLAVSSTPLASAGSDSLRTERSEIVAALSDADAELAAGRSGEAVLAVRQDGLERRIDLAIERLAKLENDADGATDEAESRRLETRVADAEADLTSLQNELAALADEAAASGRGSADQLAVGREVERLEQDLTTIDRELARRELGPLVASPVRELAAPTIKTRSALVPAAQGAAAGALIGVPVAAAVAYRARRRQLWRS